MFGRRRIVEGLLEGTSPKDLLIGDSSLRPAGWPEPGLMRAARRAGFRIVAGSDPLPFAGEERMLGRYGVAGDGAFDPRCPAASLRRWLNDPASAFRRVGTRSPLAQVLRRLAGNARAGRAA
jgi:hypothetical protein